MMSTAYAIAVIFQNDQFSHQVFLMSFGYRLRTWEPVSAKMQNRLESSWEVTRLNPACSSANVASSLFSVWCSTKQVAWLPSQLTFPVAGVISPFFWYPMYFIHQQMVCRNYSRKLGVDI